MADYTSYNRPTEQGRPTEHVHETTVVRSGSSNGVIAAVVLLVRLGIAAFIFWAGDDNMTATTTAPEATISEQAAPNTAVDPAQPVPAPDAPAIAPEAPAAPAETAPAPANDG